MVVELYQQGRSAREIIDIMGLSAVTVKEALHAAGILRAPHDAARLASHRLGARNKIANLRISSLAVRWMRGAEVEGLAAEFGAPADLLWDALSAQLSIRDGSPLKPKPDCITRCIYGCAAHCAIAAPVSDRAKFPGTPRFSGRRGRREGVPYVRTGLALPEPGKPNRWG